MSLFLYFTGGVSLLLVWLKVNNRRSVGKCNSRMELNGKTAIVTGANTGIGFITALDFSKRGAKVILACRDKGKGEKARDDICNQSGNPDVHVRVLDLTSFRSIREFARGINKNFDSLNILVNNAGGTGFPDIQTEDGPHISLQTNFFGPFLLTDLLSDLLKKSAPSRIINLTSSAYKAGHVDLDFFRESRPGVCMEGRLYCHAKLAVIMATKERARRLEGSGVTVNAADPGNVRTEFFRKMGLAHKLLLYLLGSIFSVIKTPEEGAQTSIYCAVSDEVAGISGETFADCSLQKTGSKVNDMEFASKLWKVTEKVTGINIAT